VANRHAYPEAGKTRTLTPSPVTTETTKAAVARYHKAKAGLDPAAAGIAALRERLNPRRDLTCVRCSARRGQGCRPVALSRGHLARHNVAGRYVYRGADPSTRNASAGEDSVADCQ
jgi:hypothetical protein